MKLLRSAHARGSRRGAALLLSFMVLVVVVTIVTQIRIGTMTNARVARNDITLAHMDLAVESALMESRIRLRDDGEADAEAGSSQPGGQGGGDGSPIPDASNLGGGGEDAGMGDTPPPADKKADFAPERTTINDIELRILIQDEDSKINVLNMLAEDQERAEEALLRVVRVLDRFREETEHDVPLPRAREMAQAMRRHMLERDSQKLPKPVLLSDDPERDRVGLPLSLREFLVHEEIPEILFRDFRDSNGTVVHSIESFLTVWSSPAFASGVTGGVSGGAGGGQGAAPEDDEGAEQDDGGTTTGGSGGEEASSAGFAVNVNTAPPVVLKSLFDDRDVHPSFWDEVIEYRNLEDEEAMEDEDGERREPILDEFGEEQIELQYFGSVDEFEELRGWNDFDNETQDRIRDLLTTESATFSIFVTARQFTAQEQKDRSQMNPREAAEEEREDPQLKRVVRQVVWRHEEGDEIAVTPIVPWEVLLTAPFEVLDYPDEDR